MTRGITSDGNGYSLYEQLYWIEPDRWEPLDVGFPQAYGAAWSPDGRQIAFFAAPEQGLEGIDRLDAVYNLYLMQPDGTDVRPFVKGFRYPDRPAWSPDGRWLVFSATFGNLIKQKGLWLIEVATGERRLIVRGDYGWAAWSPDGQRLVAVDSTNYIEKRQTRLVIIEIAPLLKP
jgi:Tol biopolymer transport system component